MNKAAVILGLGFGALLAFGRKSKAASSGVTGIGATKFDTELSKNFRWQELAQSASLPEIAYYQPTDKEIGQAILFATKILQPIRDLTGVPVVITSGGRPQSVKLLGPRTVTKLDGKTQVTVPAGANIDDILKARGYDPAADSDHHFWVAADFVFATVQPSATWDKVFAAISALPETRQIIIYHDAQNNPVRGHVAMVIPGRPKETGTAYAFLAKETEKMA